MVVVTIRNGEVAIPQELLRQLGLKDGDAVVVEASAANTIEVRPAAPANATEELLRLLDTPFDPGVVEPLTRAGIYDEADR